MPRGTSAKYRCPTCQAGPFRWKVLQRHFRVERHRAYSIEEVRHAEQAAAAKARAKGKDVSAAPPGSVSKSKEEKYAAHLRGAVRAVVQARPELRAWPIGVSRLLDLLQQHCGLRKATVLYTITQKHGFTNPADFLREHCADLVTVGRASQKVLSWFPAAPPRGAQGGGDSLEWRWYPPPPPLAIAPPPHPPQAERRRGRHS